MLLIKAFTSLGAGIPGNVIDLARVVGVKPHRGTAS